MIESKKKSSTTLLVDELKHLVKAFINEIIEEITGKINIINNFFIDEIGGVNHEQ